MKTLLHGFHELSEADYRALNAINKSGLDQINKSPAHYQEYLKRPPESSDAMTLGRATHLGVLEPDLLYQQFFARPEGIDGRTKEGKEKLSELGRQHAGKTMLKADDFETIEGIVRSVRGHKVASQLISGGKPELSTIAVDPEFEVLCKARPDYLGRDGIIVDLKTTESANFSQFQRSVVSFRYHVQAAWYLDLANLIAPGQFKRFILIAVEKVPPFGLMIYELSPDAIQAGRVAARANLRTYAACKLADIWPGYRDDIQTMSVPDWA